MLRLQVTWLVLVILLATIAQAETNNLLLSMSSVPERQTESIYNTTCESKNHQPRSCYVSHAIKELWAYERISAENCKIGVTFSKLLNGVKVWGGCRANFRFTVDPTLKIMKCESRQYKTKVCPVEGEIVDLYITHRLSMAKCAYELSYFKGFKSIVVKSGCRAYFAYSLL